jgi:hypothetical protein
MTVAIQKITSSTEEITTRKDYCNSFSIMCLNNVVGCKAQGMVVAGGGAQPVLLTHQGVSDLGINGEYE